MSEYFEPASVDDACALLSKGESRAAALAGGTDLVVQARSRRKSLPEVLVALHRIGDLRAISNESGCATRIAAMTTYRDLESSEKIRIEYSALADAAALVGSPATRHVGTLGGNLCNGSPAMESGSPLLVLDASVEMSSAAGVRLAPIADFLVGPSKTTLELGELVTAVTLPAAPSKSGSAYVRLQYRQGMEIAIVGAAVFVSLMEKSVVRDARVALTAVAPTCIRARAVEDALAGAPVDEALFARVAQLVADEASPISDIRAPAAYRTAMASIIARRALEKAVQRAQGRYV